MTLFRDASIPLTGSLVLLSVISVVMLRRGIRGLLSGLILAIGFIVPMDSIRAGAIGGMADVLLLAALPLLIIQRLGQRRRLSLGEFKPVMLAALGVSLGGLIGTLWSVDPGGSVLNILRFTVGIIGTLLLLSAVPRDSHDVRAYTWAFISGATVSAAYGLVHFNVHNGRSSGLALYPNTLGIVSVFAICLLLGVLSVSSARERLVGVVFAVILLAGIMNSGSRAALLGLAISTVTFLLYTRNRKMIGYLAVAVAVALVPLVTGTYVLPADSSVNRLVHPSLSAPSDFVRESLFAESVNQVSAHGFTGVGFATATQAHSVPIQIVESAGLLGTLSGTTLVIMIVRPYVRRRRDRDPLLAGFLAMYVGYLAAAVVSNPIWDRWIWFPVACGLATLKHARSTEVPKGVSAEEEPSNSGVPLADPLVS